MSLSLSNLKPVHKLKIKKELVGEEKEGLILGVVKKVKKQELVTR